MIGAKPTRLCFTPVCSEDIGEPGPAVEEEPFASVRQLRQLITDQIQVIEHLQRRRHRIARAYVRLRKQHAHVKAQRCLRWRLQRICQRQEEVWRE